VPSEPKPVVSVVDAAALTIGIVIGAGIYRTPSIVAANASSEWAVYMAWFLGGAISLVGALVYAELASTYPHAGGEYHYLTRAFGFRLSFLFAWARMSVIQTGSIAFSAFVFGDYVGQVFPLGEYSSSIYAGLVVAGLTAVNIAGVRQGTATQNLLTTIEVLGVVMVIAAGFMIAAPPQAITPAAAAPASSSVGLMMVFVLLTYGGWNEAAYVSGELRDARRNMVPVLVVSVLLITVLYVLINWAYLHALGLAGTAATQQVAAELVRRAFGPGGAAVVSILVAISALTTANATVFTGARTSYAFGCDFAPFAVLGRWSQRTATPVNALLVQGVIALALVLMGTLTRKGFETIVEYTAPVFWFFFLLTGAALFVLRLKEPGIARPFLVPLYPVTPLLFCATCAYLLYSSLAYTGVGAGAGVIVLAIGALFLIKSPTN
jgi:basic amino acid/polyamine antiporter, APA family